MSLSQFDFGLGYASLINNDPTEMESFIKPQAREWLDSFKRSEDGGDEPPFEVDYEGPSHTPRGPSILYVATFGEASLGEAPAGETPKTPDTPSGKATQHQNWGQWG